MKWQYYLRKTGTRNRAYRGTVRAASRASARRAIARRFKMKRCPYGVWLTPVQEWEK